MFGRKNVTNFALALAAAASLLSLSFGATISVPVSASSFTIAPSNESTQSPKNESWLIYSAKSGDVIEDKVKIKNQSLDQINVKIASNDLLVTNQGYFSVAEDSVQDSQVGAWTSINETIYSVPARDYIEVPFKVTIPADTKSGEYAGGITAYTVEDQQGNVAVRVRQGVRMYITVGDEFSVDTSVNNFEFVDVTNKATVSNLANKDSLGKDRVALKYDLDYKGNIFGQLNGKVNLEFADGTTKETTFSEELIPGDKTYTRFVYLDEAYKEGLSKARMVYTAVPLNTNSAVESSGVKEASLDVDQAALEKADVAKNPVFNEPLSQKQETSSQTNIWLYVSIAGVVVLIAVLIGISAWLYLKTKKQ